MSVHLGFGWCVIFWGEGVRGGSSPKSDLQIRLFTRFFKGVRGHASRKILKSETSETRFPAFCAYVFR